VARPGDAAAVPRRSARLGEGRLAPAALAAGVDLASGGAGAAGEGAPVGGRARGESRRGSAGREVGPAARRPPRQGLRRPRNDSRLRRFGTSRHVGRAADRHAAAPRLRAGARRFGGGRRGLYTVWTRDGGLNGGSPSVIMSDSMRVDLNAFRLLVFDWDGTLMDSIGTIAACTRAVVRELGLREVPEETIRGTIGLGLRETMDVLSPGCDDAMLARIVECYR